LEPWEKAIINYAEFSQDVHGQQACTECHNGDAATADKEAAHNSLISRPSEGPDNICQDCHPDVAEVYKTALHATQQGYFTTMYARSVPENHDELQTMFGNHCASCHTTCGDCHISQPASVGGGLFDGHLVQRTPPMTRSCTACHGSRVGNEYLGKNEGIPGDVHFRSGRMNCVDCHSSHELHGQPANCSQCHTGPEAAQVPPPDHRYSGLQMPSCESCHAAVTTGQDGIEMHAQHGNNLSCQVCHSTTYTSCDGCHVAVSETTGNPFFETEATYHTFFIGRNPNPTFSRPYEFVPVRHIPIAPTSYEFYGENLLPNFNALPTWAYATPHNIQTTTPQAETCNACHGNVELFLTIDKVRPEELEANRDVIVETVPERLEDQPLPEEEGAEGEAEGSGEESGEGSEDESGEGESGESQP
jgi:thiosulfate/3-mercaptopyruvate sulfurtransferase